jgi:hypothetical protein
MISTRPRRDYEFTGSKARHSRVRNRSAQPPGADGGVAHHTALSNSRVRTDANGALAVPASESIAAACDTPKAPGLTRLSRISSYCHGAMLSSPCSIQPLLYPPRASVVMCRMPCYRFNPYALFDLLMSESSFVMPRSTASFRTNLGIGVKLHSQSSGTGRSLSIILATPSFQSITLRIAVLCLLTIGRSPGDQARSLRSHTQLRTAVTHLWIGRDPRIPCPARALSSRSRSET